MRTFLLASALNAILAVAVGMGFLSPGLETGLLRRDEACTNDIRLKREFVYLDDLLLRWQQS
jgi:hypothetical protein